MEEGERRPPTFRVWLTSNHTTVFPPFPRTAVLSCGFVLSAQILTLVHVSLLESRKVDHPKPHLWYAEFQKRERGKESPEGKEVQNEGKEKGRRVDNGKRSRGWMA